MIVGGYPSQNYKRVLIFDSTDKSYTPGPDLLYTRFHAGCTVFNSAKHSNRPVVLAAGGSVSGTAEVFDYTNTNAWEESK